MRRALYILAELDDGDIAWLVANGTVRRLAEGEMLIREGVAIADFFIVIDGRLGVSVAGGREIAELQVGDIAGEMSLVEQRPPSASVAARLPCRLLAVPQAILRERLAIDPGFAARFYRALAVFLSDRLRSTVAVLERGQHAAEGAQQAFERENELDEGVLDNLHLAGDRLRRLMAMLDGRG